MAEGGTGELPGSWLRQQRETAGLTQEELAERSGVSVRTISDLERGRVAKPYPRSVRSLVTALALPAVTADELIAAFRAVRNGHAAPPVSGTRPDGHPLTARTAAAPVPRELPAAVAHFAGRASELKALDELLELSARSHTTAVMISAIGGTAGVGKTALAVHWAQRVADRFPDGQLYANLRGYDSGQPVRPADALAGFLRALGIPAQDVPAEADERAARYRSLLAGLRVLVVLDNARSVEQVRPLLPGAAACFAVVTSRDSLAGLVARDGAHRLELDVLPRADAVGLLRELIGDRVDADPAAAATLATQCSRLPLALRVAAEFAAARPQVSLAGLVADLADQQRRLDLLDAEGDPHTAVRAVFSWSYQHLDGASARAFRLLGLLPGPDFDGHAAAALTGAMVGDAARALDLLARAHLIQPDGTGRYAMHDLLRSYARELAVAGGQDAVDVALTRVFNYYLYASATAMDTVFPAQRHRRPRIPRPVAAVPPLTGEAAARAWLDAERNNLAAAVGHTAAHGWPGHTTRLATTVFAYFGASGRFAEAITMQSLALRAARRTGDRAAEAASLTDLGVADFAQGRYQQAVDRFQQALALFREVGDRAGEARAVHNVGAAEFPQGRYQQAAGHIEQALALFREVDDQIGEARALGSLGVTERRLGRHEQAAGHLKQALALCRRIGDRAGEIEALISLGVTERRQGRDQQAAGHLEQALALCRETGNLPAQAEALTNLGFVDLYAGRHQRAMAHLERALRLCRDLGTRTGEAETLTGLGLVHLKQGRHQQATEHLEQALALCRETGNRSGEAEALNGLGELHLAAGRTDRAGGYYTAALDVASEIGDHDEQARARQGLALAAPRRGDGI